MSLNSFHFGAFRGGAVQKAVLSKSNKINSFAMTCEWLHLGAGILVSIRNRQVAGSSPALGSNIPLSCSDLENSLNSPRLICCKIAASCEFFVERVERIHLQFVHGLDVDVLGYSDIAVAQNGLNCFIVHAQRVEIRRKPAPECVPAMPHRERLIALEGVSTGQVSGLLLTTDHTG